MDNLRLHVERCEIREHVIQTARDGRHDRRFDDLFQSFGPIAVKRMFGGEGIFAGPVMIGLVMDAQIFMRTDENTRPDYLAQKSRPFTFRKGGKTITTAYYSLVKKFHFTERVNVEMRLEMLNVFNNINFLVGAAGNDVNSVGNLTSTAFARMTAAYQDLSTTNDPGGRVGQLVLRVNF